MMSSREKVIALAAKIKSDMPHAADEDVANGALRKVFGLVPGDGIFGGSAAAVAMGFDGHPDTENLFQRISDRVQEEMGQGDRSIATRIAGVQAALQMVQPKSATDRGPVAPRMNTFSLRAECEVDVQRLQQLIDRDSVGSSVTSKPYSSGDPDQLVEIRTALSHDLLTQLIEEVPDGHTMRRTLELGPLADSTIDRRPTQPNRAATVPGSSGP